ncbi:TonB-dependent receptor [Fulvivirga maritima]|uniref:SusC/RagA family TonB-linked outer membrane protein n=1 Tax=Fulvivirga maritima TaxID=2904247 RepID=UPI001F3E665B|nr:TonB-dependent receptor [Fulvivirga maritima]UII27297.1 TonB-dependent receptor [Fulvivirga maritima]
MRETLLLYLRKGFSGALSLIVCLALLFYTSVLFAQQQSITGTVLSGDGGEPLPGVAVMVKGTSSGTVTDIDGEYTIKAGPNDVLIYSFVGYATHEIAVGSKTKIDVELTEDITALQEVVVVGYGKQKKTDVTGSLVSVDAAKISEVPAATGASSALQGRIAGVQISQTSSRPGSDPQIRIRGNRSLGSGDLNSPLIVVDGIPFSGSLNDINPTDIESFNVLKDASATAIYGSRGANGVILITTKRGRVGELNFSYNGYAGVTQALGKYDLMNGEEFARLKLYTDANFTEAELQSLQEARSTDWQDLMIKDGYIQNHNLSVIGGSENTQFAVSTGYFKQTTVFPGQSFKRYNLKLSLDQRVNDWLKVGISTLNSISYRKGEGVSPMFNILTLSPLYNAYNEDGEVEETPAEGSLDPNLVNPLTLYRDGAWEEDRRRIRTFNTAYLEVNLPVEGLSYKLNAGLDYRQDEYGRFFSEVTPMQNIDNGNAASISNSDTWGYTIENLILYERSFGEHSFKFTGLYSVQEEEYNSSGVNAVGVLANDLQYYNLSLAANNVIPGSAYNYTRWGLSSFMARLNYNFNDRYVATVTVRRDGSSRLADGNEWFTYPGFAVGWNIHNESFLSENDFLSNLRLRVGYGRTSNQAVAPYSSIGKLDQIRYNFGNEGGAIGFYVSNLANTDLTWEFTNSFNVGLDFGLLTNRITGSIDYYQNRTDGVLQEVQLPITSGITGSFTQNVGETKGEGIEMMISGEAIEALNRNEFGLGFDVNFTSYSTEIVKLTEGRDSNPDRAWFVGEPINVLYDYEKVGIWQLDEADEAAQYGDAPGDIKVKDQDGDDDIDDEDRTILGQLDPKWSFGFTARASFKGFDLSVVTFGMFGHEIVSSLYQMNSSNPVNSLEGRRNGPDVDYWTEDNPTNEFSRPGRNTVRYGSTTGYFSGDFVKIRSINLGYQLPNDLLDKVGLKSARVYFSASNPFKAFFSDYVDYGGLDPEPTSRGVTNGITPGLGNKLTVSADTPPVKTFMLGVNLTF